MYEREEIEQIWPAHADHISYYKDKFIDDLFKEDAVVAQRKYDGERMLIHFLNGKVWCTSRRISKKTGKYQENQDKLANLPTLPKDFKYTVIDCECYADTWSESAGVLHSLPERALELQKTINIRFAVFDCLFYEGIDVRDTQYRGRIAMAERIVGLLRQKDERFHWVADRVVKSKEDAWKAAQEQWDQGREGVVIKALGKHYYDKGAMLKIKRTETVDVVVYDYQPGRGKYEGVVGALLVGYYDPETDSIKHLSKVNCGTDEDRATWQHFFNELVVNHEPCRVVLEVKCQEITDKSLRHPVYIRIREDKDYKMCTRDTIFKE